MTKKVATAQLIQLFSTGILVADIPDIDNTILAQAVRELRTTEGRSHGLISGDGLSSYKATQGLHKLPTFQPLIEALRSRIIGFARELGADMGRTDLVVTECWFNIQQPGSQLIQHRHRNSILSGAYYVEAPANCGRIVFETPLVAHRMSDFPHYARETAFSMTQYAVDPSPGRLVLFPSWLGHRTEINQANAERIVVSFNVVAQRSSKSRSRTQVE